MLDDASDEEERHLAQAAVFAAEKEVPPALPERDVAVHSTPTVAVHRLGHERRGLPMVARNIFDDVLEPHHLIAHRDGRVEAHVDLRTNQ